MSGMDEDFFAAPTPARRPTITVDAILLAAEVGATCPHLLAEVFGVGLISPDLTGLIAAMAKAKILRAIKQDEHQVDGGWTCTPFVLSVPTVEDHPGGMQ